jgi:hypothetical protein
MVVGEHQRVPEPLGIGVDQLDGPGPPRVAATPELGGVAGTGAHRQHVVGVEGV